MSFLQTERPREERGRKRFQGRGVKEKKGHTRASRERCNRLQCFSTAREQSVLRVDGGNECK